MTKEGKITPPHTQADGLPDFFLGRLIYYDVESNNNCRWVIYDGSNTIRFPSRASAERYCCEKAIKIHECNIGEICRCAEHVRRSFIQLDKTALLLPIDERLRVQRVALALRKAFDELDTLISQYTK